MNRTVHTKTCEVCQKEYQTVTTIKRYCSNECLNASRRYKRMNGLIVSEVLTKACVECNKTILTKNPDQKFCSDSCFRKNHRKNNVEKYKERDRKKIKKNTIGLHIRDEHLGQPTRRAKWLWDGMGRWSVKYWPEITECLECNTNVYRHRANGVCEYCLDKLKYKDPERVKELKQKHYQKMKEAGKVSSQSQSKMWIKKAKNQEIPITPVISNLLNNLDEL